MLTTALGGLWADVVEDHFAAPLWCLKGRNLLYKGTFVRAIPFTRKKRKASDLESWMCLLHKESVFAA